MKIVGIIAEYDPFHLGHLYHIKKTRELLGEDCLIVVALGGEATQRGIFSLNDKFTRAKSALLGGADLVVGLNGIASVQSANIFAAAGVKTLKKVGVQALSFGAETLDEDFFAKLTAISLEEAQSEINMNLTRNCSYASVRSKVFSKMLGVDEAELKKPNNILALEYAIENNRQGECLELLPIKRLGNFKGISKEGEFFGASYIRRLLEEGKDQQATKHLLPEMSEILLTNRRKTEDEKVFLNLILYKLLFYAEELTSIFEVEEGFDNRIKEAALKANSYSQLVEGLVTKHYTRLRCQRALMNFVLGIDKNMVKALKEWDFEYVRVLAMNSCGQNYLAKRKKEVGSPLFLTNPRKQKASLSECSQLFYKKECEIYNLYNKLYKSGFLPEEKTSPVTTV